MTAVRKEQLRKHLRLKDQVNIFAPDLQFGTPDNYSLVKFIYTYLYCHIFSQLQSKALHVNLLLP